MQMLRAVGPLALSVALAGLVTLDPGSAAAQTGADCGKEYVVRRGDTLSLIARALYGRNRYQQLYRLNAQHIGPNPNVVEVGTRLWLPCNLDAALRGDEPAPVTWTPEPPDAVAAPDDPQPARSGQIEIAFGHNWESPDRLDDAVIAPLLRDISDATRGRVSFTVLDNGANATRTVFERVKRGDFDGGLIANQASDGADPLLEITKQPLVGGTALETAIALTKIHQDYFASALPMPGMKMLGFISEPPAQLWTFSDNRTLASLEKAGVTIEPPSNWLPTGGAVMTYAQASKLGVIARRARVIELNGGMFVPTYSVVISEDKWEQISLTDRAAIEALIGEGLAQRSAVLDRFEQAEKRAMIRRGLVVEEPDLDMLAALQGQASLSWENWIAAANREGVSGYEAINAFFREIEAQRQASGS